MSHKLLKPKNQGFDSRVSVGRRKDYVLVGTYRHQAEYANWITSHLMYNYPDVHAKDLGHDIDEIGHILLLKEGRAPMYFDVTAHFGVSRTRLVSDFEYPTSAKSVHNGYELFQLTPAKMPKKMASLKGRNFLINLSDFIDDDMGKAVITHALSEESGDGRGFSRALSSMTSSDFAGIVQSNPDAIRGNLEQLDLFGWQPPFPPPKNPSFKFIDLFAGIGGFRIAMQNCGGKCVFTSEFDPYAQKTYQANFGDFPFGDITKQETHDKIPENFDVVCAGFPCQAFSLAGKRQGFKDNFKGMSRGTLFQEVVKICEKHRPKAVFCENVKGLYLHDHGNTFKVIKGAFEEIGYRFFWKILNSKDFGVPQHRERIYMVAFRNDCAPEEFAFPEPTGRRVCLSQIRQGSMPGDPPVTGRYYLSDVYVETLRRHRRRHEEAGHGFGYVIRKWDGISGAIVCGGMGRETNLVQEEGNKTPPGIVPETHIKGKINEEGIRKMTPLEWARLQGFPDGYKLVLSDVHLYKQFGNSVSIPVIQAIAQRIVEQLERR